MTTLDSGSISTALAAMDEGIAALAQQVPELPTADTALLRALLVLGPALQAAVETELRRHGLGDSEFRTLATLFSRPDGCASPSELCTMDTLSRANMTRIGDVLVGSGFATRRAAINDRRRLELCITGKGRRVVRHVIPKLVPALDAVFSGIPATRKRELVVTLKRIAANLDDFAAGARS